MRILQITAGAANMYCGSCLRDNTLAAELKRQGHDVVLMPVYTPTLTDEANVSESRVFFGGISVYLQQKSALFRHTPEFVDRLLFDNNWALRKASGKSIGVDPKFLGEMTVDMLRGSGGPLAKEFRKLCEWVAGERGFDVISLPFTLLIAMAEPLRRAGRTRIVCTLQGEDLFLDGLMEPYRTQAKELIAANLDHVDRFIAVSQYYADYMAKYLRIPKEKLSVAPIGLSMQGFEPKPKPKRSEFRLGYFARMDPVKGFHTLAEAYRLLRKRPGLPPLRLGAAGYLLAEHREYLEGETAKLAGMNFAYHGALDREQKIQFLQEADLICVPANYAEPKGLFVLEALASGTPIVLPSHGAFPEILSRTGGGVLFPPGDVEALADTLQSMILEEERRLKMAEEGALNVRKHYSAEVMAAAHLNAYSS
jgi:glycosyltransferase involved in cell wall biosynthesis